MKPSKGITVRVDLSFPDDPGQGSERKYTITFTNNTSLLKEYYEIVTKTFTQ